MSYGKELKRLYSMMQNLNDTLIFKLSGSTTLSGEDINELSGLVEEVAVKVGAVQMPMSRRCEWSLILVLLGYLVMSWIRIKSLKPTSRHTSKGVVVKI